MVEEQDLAELAPEAPQVHAPATPPWLWPAVMIVLALAAVLVAVFIPAHGALAWFVPYTFAGNSLIPLPYDPAVVYLGTLYPIWLVVVVGVAATVIVEYWNMELLARILSREGTRRFRGHHVTKWLLSWYRRAPFLTLVFTCAVPIIPHYPMRILATLANYPMWKYQLSVVIGRGARYSWLALLGVALAVPPWILLVLSLAFLAVMVWKLRQMNAEPEVVTASGEAH